MLDFSESDSGVVAPSCYPSIVPDSSTTANNHPTTVSPHYRPVMASVGREYEGLYLPAFNDSEYYSPMGEAIQPICYQSISLLGGGGHFLEHPTLGDGLEPTWSGVSACWHLAGVDEDWDETVLNLPPKKRPETILIDTAFYHAPPDVWSALATPEQWEWITRRCNTKLGGLYLAEGGGILRTPILWEMDGKEYQVLLNLRDIKKLGPAGKGFKGLLKLTGCPVEAKGLMDNHIQDMRVPYRDPELHGLMKEYALGDVQYGPHIIQTMDEMKREMYTLVTGGLEFYNGSTAELDSGRVLNFPPPGNGSMNHRMFKALAYKRFREAPGPEVLPWENFSRVDSNTGKETPWELDDMAKRSGFKALLRAAGEQDTFRYKLALTAGGLAKNMEPTRTLIEGVVVDDDGGGMYAGIMRRLFKPIGLPTIWANASSGTRKRKTLGAFIKEYPQDIGQRTWYAIICTTGRLSFDQDVIQSKILDVSGKRDGGEASKGLADKLKGDGLQDSVVLLTREIVNGVLTAGTLEALRLGSSQREWKELCEKVEIQASVMFLDATRCDSPEEMKERIFNDPGGIVEWVDKKTGDTHHMDKRNKAWWPQPLADVTEVLSNGRKDAQKALKAPGISPDEAARLNTLQSALKEQVNSCFGSMSSDIWDLGSAVTAHNITGEGRAWGWYFQKAMLAQGVITDGHFGDINQVDYRGERGLSLNTLANLTRPGNAVKNAFNTQVKQGPLLGPGEWVVEGTGRTVTDDDGEHQVSRLLKGGELFEEGWEGEWPKLSKALHEHMMEFWGGRDVCPVVVRETVHKIKDVYAKGASHGQVNYLLENADGAQKIKARGHKTRKGDAFHSYDSKAKGNDGSHMVDMLQTIAKGEGIPAYRPQYRSQMLNHSEWYGRDGASVAGNVAKGVYPGASVAKRTWVRPLSLSTFKWQSLEQYRGWTSQHDRAKVEKGYGLEAFYLGADGMVNYADMVQDIQSRIDQGQMGYLGPTKGPEFKNVMKTKPNHPHNP